MSTGDPKTPRRRDLLGMAVGGSAAALGAALVVPVARFVEPPADPTEGAVKVGKVEDFPLGASRTVLVHDRPVLVIHTEGGELRAFSALCTHLRCVVAYSAERNRIECPCHRGVFSIDGRAVAGPPRAALEELVVRVEGDVVVVSGA